MTKGNALRRHDVLQPAPEGVESGSPGFTPSTSPVSPFAHLRLRLQGLAPKPKPEPIEPEPIEEEKEYEEIEIDPARVTRVTREARALVPAPAVAVAPRAARYEVAIPTVSHANALVQLLNQKHAVIGNYGDKLAVLSWERWRVDPQQLVPSFQKPMDFKNRYANKYVAVKTDKGSKHMPAGAYWFADPGRLTYEGVAFEPGEPGWLLGNRLNLYRGFAVEPRRGSWRLMLRHIYRVLAGGDRKAGRYILRWLAWTLQNPGKQAEAVLVFQGDEGAGKGTLARAMLQIFGPAALPISSPKLLVGAFSGHLQHCVFLFLDEAFWAGDRTAENRLKALVTEPTITIEPKYFNPFQIRNCLHLVMASNNDWVVPAAHGARRYAVFKVSSARVDDFNYFDAVNAEMKAGGVEAMLYDLLRLDLSGWHPKRIYKTAALADQKQHSLRGLDAWIEAVLQEGKLPKPWKEYANRCLSDHLLASAQDFDQYTNKTRIALRLQELFGVEPFNNQSARGWIFPSLAECREAWERHNGGHWRWHSDVEEWLLR